MGNAVSERLVYKLCQESDSKAADRGACLSECSFNKDVRAICSHTHATPPAPQKRNIGSSLYFANDPANPGIDFDAAFPLGYWPPSANGNCPGCNLTCSSYWSNTSFVSTAALSWACLSSLPTLRSHPLPLSLLSPTHPPAVFLLPFPSFISLTHPPSILLILLVLPW